jgi:WD40 repeat protein
LYFDEKESNILKGINESIFNNKTNDFKIIVEDVVIPKKLKLKTKAHKKIITSLKFNGFGTNFLTTGDDNFVKVWDATKRII